MSLAGFTDQPKVANGASGTYLHSIPVRVQRATLQSWYLTNVEFLMELFGECGKHARSAVGVAELPLGVYVSNRHWKPQMNFLPYKLWHLLPI